MRPGQLLGQRDGDAPRSRSDVGQGGVGDVAQQIERSLHHALRLGPRHEGAPVAFDCQRPELRRADQVLDGFARGAPPDKFAEPVHRLRGQRFLEARVEVNPFASQCMGEQFLGGEAGRINAFRREVGRGDADEFQRAPRSLRTALRLLSRVGVLFRVRRVRVR